MREWCLLHNIIYNGHLRILTIAHRTGRTHSRHPHHFTKLQLQNIILKLQFRITPICKNYERFMEFQMEHNCSRSVELCTCEFVNCAFHRLFICTQSVQYDWTGTEKWLSTLVCKLNRCHVCFNYHDHVLNQNNLLKTMMQFSGKLLTIWVMTQNWNKNAP